MSDSDLISLYSGRILNLAANIPHLGRLTTPQATATRRSPLCGSSLTVDVAMDQGRVVRLGMDVKACALGQAAAAIMAQNAIGCTVAQLDAACDTLRSMLCYDGPVPQPPFDGFGVLIPARAYPNRHASVMLAIEAVAEAARTADSPAPA